MNEGIKATAVEYRAAVIEAAMRYRAIMNNRPHGQTQEQHRDNDARVSMAELRLEGALLRSQLISLADVIRSIDIKPDRLEVVTLDRIIEIPT